jgi:hypothetical protein
MTDRIKRQDEAFREALWCCRLYGLNWRNHVIPKIEKKEITGYYVLDETRSTAIKTIMM